MNHISFPGLGLEFNIDPIALRLPFGISVHWYGIIIGIGILVAVCLVYHEIKKSGYDTEIFLDIVLVTVPLSIVGARLYYVIFSWDDYKNNLGKIIEVWNGGLAIYGAVITGAICVAILTHVKKIPFLWFADLAVMGLIIAQAIGRWGNFVNAEAHGGETDLPWRMVIGTSEAVHPAFLYESVLNLTGFLIMYFIIYRMKKKDGWCLTFYMIWYGAGRFFIEKLRTDSLCIGHSTIRVSRVVAALSVAGGIILAFYIKFKAKMSVRKNT